MKLKHLYFNFFFVSFSIVFYPFIYVNFIFHIPVYYFLFSIVVLLLSFLQFFFMKPIKHRNLKLGFIFGLFFFILFISNIESDFIFTRDLFKVLIYLLITILAIFYIVIRDKDLLEKYFTLQIFAIWLLSAYGIFSVYYTNKPWLQFSAINGDFGSRNVDAYLLLYGFVISLIFIKNKLFKFFVILSITFAILLTLSRGAIICTIIISITYLIINKKLIKIIYLMPLIFYFIFHSSIFYYARLILERFKEIFYSPRIELIKDSIELIQNNFISGVGFKNFSKFTSIYIPHLRGEELIYIPLKTSHNSFLNLFVETGIFGFLLYLVIMLYPLYIFVKYKAIFTKNKLGKLSLLLIIYNIYINFFNVFYIDAGYLFWFAYANTFIILNSIYTMERYIPKKI